MWNSSAMISVRRPIDFLSVALVIGYAAWFVPQRYLGAYQGLFPEPFQISLSLTITIGFAVRAFQVVKLAWKKRTFPWGATTMLVVSFMSMELIWRLVITPLPSGDFKVGWVIMLFAQPVLAMVSVLILARSWRDFSLHRQPGP